MLYYRISRLIWAPIHRIFSGFGPSMVFVAINPPLVSAQFRREAAKIFGLFKSLTFWAKSGAFSTLAINPPLFRRIRQQGGVYGYE